MVSLAEAPRPGLEQKNLVMASAATAQDALDDQAALFDSDEFRMYCYKVLPCAKRAAHEWTTCPWAHPGEKARRRDPRVYSYLAIPCPDTKEGKECPRGDDCPNCHSLFEYWLHPSRYRTQLCRNNDGSHCKRQICFFAHSIDELRVPDHSHLNIPDELKQQSSGGSSPKTATAAAAAAPDSGSSSPSHKAHKDRRGGKSSAGKAPAAAKDWHAAGSPVHAAGTGSLSRHPSLPVPCAEHQVLCRSLSVDVGVRNGNAGGSSSTLARMAFGGFGSGSEAAAAGGMFSCAMPGDPEVPEPLPSPQRAAAMATAQQQQQMLALREQQQQQHLAEASLTAAAAQAMYEHNMNLQQLLMLQQQQQIKQQQAAAAWAGYGAAANAAAAAGFSSEYGSVMSSASPPLSPDSASLLSSVGPDDANSSMGGYTSYGSSSCSYVSPYAGGSSMSWQRPPLPRTLSGPTSYSPQAAQCNAQSPAFRYQSLDSGVSAAAAAASAMPGSAAEVAAMRSKQLQQAEMLRYSPQARALAMMAMHGGYAPPAGSMGMCASPQYAAQQQMMQAQQQQQQNAQQQGLGDQLNLGDVADLVDSVNRGELGECGSQVLTGVIGLLMQQLQHQQLAA
uniref:C3H1-type domain-containing protein n=1 Tax=Tetradesmus obliquus TaxID=3088 RepID=A0A383VAV7_TETOB|eukprot:jgi/Sobl393_1/6610/SZX61892.1